MRHASGAWPNTGICLPYVLLGCRRRHSSRKIFNFWTHTSGVFGPLHRSRSTLPCRINSSSDILGALLRNFSRDSDSDSKLIRRNMFPRLGGNGERYSNSGRSSLRRALSQRSYRADEVLASNALTASSVLSMCRSGLGPPVCNTHPLPASTPHVGHGTATKCSGVMYALAIRKELAIREEYDGVFHKDALFCTVRSGLRPT